MQTLTSYFDNISAMGQSLSGIIVTIAAAFLTLVSVIIYFRAKMFYQNRQQIVSGYEPKELLNPRMSVLPQARPYAIAFLHVEGPHQFAIKYGPTPAFVFFNGFLKVLKSHLDKEFPASDFQYFRFMEDEVAVIIPYTPHPDILVERLKKSLRDLTPFDHPLTLQEAIPVTFHITAGIAFSNPDSEYNQKLVEYAHFAATRCTPEDQVKVFDLFEYDEDIRNVHRFRDITKLLKARDVYTIFHPIIDVREAKIIGFEALTRTDHPQFKQHPITYLLKTASQNSLYWKLEKLMSLTAIETFRDQAKESPEIRATRLYLNMAPSSILQDIYKRDIQAERFADIKYTIEVVEKDPYLTDVIQNLHHTFSGFDIEVAIDDFGTGYTNHLALIQTRPDIIKVARELIENIDKDPQKRRVYKHLINFAQEANIKVLAEGIETMEEFKTLLELGMDYAQGYLFSRPQRVLSTYLDPKLAQMFKDSLADQETPLSLG